MIFLVWPHVALFVHWNLQEQECGHFKISPGLHLSCWAVPLVTWTIIFPSLSQPLWFAFHNPTHFSSACCELWHIPSKLFILTVVCVIHLIWDEPKSQITCYFSRGETTSLSSEMYFQHSILASNKWYCVTSLWQLPLKMKTPSPAIDRMQGEILLLLKVQGFCARPAIMQCKHRTFM